MGQSAWLRTRRLWVRVLPGAPDSGYAIGSAAGAELIQTRQPCHQRYAAMRAQQLQQPAPISNQPLRLVELPDPEPMDGELVVRVAACAICRTDLQLVEGDLVARRLP